MILGKVAQLRQELLTGLEQATTQGLKLRYPHSIEFDAKPADYTADLHQPEK